MEGLELGRTTKRRRNRFPLMYLYQCYPVELGFGFACGGSRTVGQLLCFVRVVGKNHRSTVLCSTNERVARRVARDSTLLFM